MSQTHSSVLRRLRRPSLAAATLIGLLAMGLTGGCRQEPQVSAPKPLTAEQAGRFYQAVGHQVMDQPEAAAEILVALAREGAADPALAANLAAARCATGQFAEAEALARQAVANAAQSAGVRLILAAALEGLARDDEALAMVRGAVAAEASDIQARWRLAQQLEHAGQADSQERSEQLAMLARLTPANLAVLLELGRDAAKRGELKEAEARLNQVAAALGGWGGEFAPAAADVEQAVERGAADDAYAAITALRNRLRGTERYRADVRALGPAPGEPPSPLDHPILEAQQTPAPRPVEPRFVSATEAWGMAAVLGVKPARWLVAGALDAERAATLLVCDADGRLRLLVWRDSRFEEQTSQRGIDALTRGTQIENALFFDANNDGRADIVVGGQPRDLLLIQGDGGQFSEEGEVCGLGQEASRGAFAFDVENDGDLDLIRWSEAVLRVDQNDGAARFTPATGLVGFPERVDGLQQALARDLDDDGDLDLVLIRADDAKAEWRATVLANLRMGRFRDVSALIGCEQPAAAPPLIADLDQNGRLEWLDRTHAREFASDFQVIEQRPVVAASQLPSAARYIAADLVNAGRLAIVGVQASGDSTLKDVRVAPGAQLLPLDIDRDGLLDLMGTDGSAWRNTTQGAGHWLSLALQGLNEGDSKFNFFGLGSVVEVRVGRRYQRLPVDGPVVHVGLGPAPQADVVRISWPNGNYQDLRYRVTDVMRLMGNRHVVQRQELKGSCPYLYAWDGERFAFVTDVLWRSALGMSLGGGALMPAASANDQFLIGAQQLRPRGGAYHLQLTEELWETAYLDFVELLAVDRPADALLVVDEQCTPPPFPPAYVYLVREPRAVVAARGTTGQDVSALLAERDRRYVVDFAPSPYQGIVEPHELILELAQFDPEAGLRLFLNGWIMPTDASLNVALAQRPEFAPQFPALDVSSDGVSWRPSGVRVGFPSGKSKTIAIELSGKLAAGDRFLRLRTNLAIYWDHVFYEVGAAEAPAALTPIPLRSAQLWERGSSRQRVLWENGPTIPDYEDVDPLRRWRTLAGSYTECGDVTAMLEMRDDRYVVMGDGDAVELVFDAAALADPLAGQVREFVFRTDGWLKDGDLNTATGATVAPLPWRGMSSYPPPADEQAAAPAALKQLQEQTLRRWRDDGAYRQVIRQDEVFSR